MEDLEYLFAAFAIVWAATFVYLVILLRRERRLRNNIDSIKQIMQEKGLT